MNYRSWKKNRKDRRAEAKRRKELGRGLEEARETVELSRTVARLNPERLAPLVPRGISPLSSALAMMRRDSAYEEAVLLQATVLDRLPLLFAIPARYFRSQTRTSFGQSALQEAMHHEEPGDTLAISNCHPDDLKRTTGLTIEQLLEAAEKFPKPPERLYAGDARVDLTAFARKYFPESLYPSIHDAIARGVCSAAEDVIDRAIPPSAV